MKPRSVILVVLTVVLLACTSVGMRLWWRHRDAAMVQEELAGLRTAVTADGRFAGAAVELIDNPQGPAGKEILVSVPAQWAEQKKREMLEMVLQQQMRTPLSIRDATRP